ARHGSRHEHCRAKYGRAELRSSPHPMSRRGGASCLPRPHIAREAVADPAIAVTALDASRILSVVIQRAATPVRSTAGRADRLYGGYEERRPSEPGPVHGDPATIACVPDLLHHIASFARFSANRGERERHDADAMRELASRPLELGLGLELEWLGVAGYRLSYEGQTIYIDPYLSRVPLSSVFRRAPALADPSLHERHLRPSGTIVGVLVGHTHFDHAIDVPEIARRHGCSAYGSSSLVNLMRLHGLAHRAVEVEPGRWYELGPFTVTFIPSLHSKLLLGF